MPNERSKSCPGDLDVQDTLALVYIRKNLTNDGIRMLRDLVIRKPDSAPFHLHLALALYQKGDRPWAKRELQTALRHQPSAKEQNQDKGIACESWIIRPQDRPGPALTAERKTDWAAVPYVLPFAVFIAFLALQKYVPLPPSIEFLVRDLLLAAVLFGFSRHVIQLRPSASAGDCDHWRGGVRHLGGAGFAVPNLSPALAVSKRAFWTAQRHHNSRERPQIALGAVAAYSAGGGLCADPGRAVLARLADALADLAAIREDPAGRLPGRRLLDYGRVCSPPSTVPTGTSD